MSDRNRTQAAGKIRSARIAVHRAGAAGRAELPGLRGRKKALQRLELINVAIELFGADGYENVRMEDIGAIAGVSTKTVYNYFRTKRDILIEFLISDREKVVGEYQKVLDSPSGNPTEDLVRLMEVDISDVSSPGQKALWLEIMAVTVRARHDERFRRYRRMFTSYIERLLGYFQGKGKLAASLDLELAADMIHTLHSENFVQFCAAADLTLADALLLARQQLRLLLAKWEAGSLRQS